MPAPLDILFLLPRSGQASAHLSATTRLGDTEAAYRAVRSGRMRSRGQTQHEHDASDRLRGLACSWTLAAAGFPRFG